MNVAIHRETDARALNAIVNDKDIAPHIGATTAGERFDFSQVVENPENVNLIGQYGGMLAIQITPGIYEIHTHVLKFGRGKWAVGMVRAALHHLFTRTGAAEIMTKVPKGNFAAAAMVKIFGGTYEFTAPAGWVTDNQPVPAGVYALTLQEWARKTPEIAERGQWFYRRLAEELTMHGHRDVAFDPDAIEKMGASRAVGLAFEMIAGEQYGKAEAFYRRWAFLSGAKPIEILHQGVPASVKFGDILLIVRQNDLFVPYIQPEHLTPQ